MTWLVQARPINDPFSDPGVFVDFRFGRRAVLFDLGDLGVLSARELLRVSDAFVSHAHMDHFAGFDRLLRVCLHRDKALRLLGPPGFVDRVEHKLRAYTWNLLDEDSFDFVIAAVEFDGKQIARRAEFRAREGFRRSDVPSRDLALPVVLDASEFSIECAMLDHGTPSLAFALQEKERINVWRAGLDRLGLPVGPWLNRAKQAARARAPDDFIVEIGNGRTIAMGELREHVLRSGAGQRIAYVVDAGYETENIEKVVRLADAADQLFIEAAFLDCDAALAAHRRHLRHARPANLRGVPVPRGSWRCISRPAILGASMSSAPRRRQRFAATAAKPVERGEPCRKPRIRAA